MLTRLYRTVAEPTLFVTGGSPASQATAAQFEPTLFQNWLVPERQVGRSLFATPGVMRLTDSLFVALEAGDAFSPEQLFTNQPNGWYMAGLVQG